MYSVQPIPNQIVITKLKIGQYDSQNNKSRS